MAAHWIVISEGKEEEYLYELSTQWEVHDGARKDSKSGMKAGTGIWWEHQQMGVNKHDSHQDYTEFKVKVLAAQNRPSRLDELAQSAMNAMVSNVSPEEMSEAMQLLIAENAYQMAVKMIDYSEDFKNKSQSVEP